MSGDDFWAGIETRHAAAVDRGEHDGLCEWRPGFYLCHCSKREREARGLTTPPTLTHQYPLCSGCDREVYHNGDGWECGRCHTSWSSGAGEDERGTFTDDHGDLSGGPR
ncbi:MAG: hypothetical protein JJE50_15865 [Actinomycetales bacterium]|nr:hypothetical protein [Actinomycetales bacterium]